MPNQDNPNLKNSWENKTVLFIALLALFTAKFLPNHIEHKQIEHKKQEIQNQKIKVAKTTQIEEQKINIQNLQQEYSDILNLAKKLGITVVFVKDKIEFHCDSQINFEYLQTRLTQLGIPALSERPKGQGGRVATTLPTHHGAHQWLWRKDARVSPVQHCRNRHVWR